MPNDRKKPNRPPPPVPRGRRKPRRAPPPVPTESSTSSSTSSEPQPRTKTPPPRPPKSSRRRTPPRPPPRSRKPKPPPRLTQEQRDRISRDGETSSTSAPVSRHVVPCPTSNPWELNVKVVSTVAGYWPSGNVKVEARAGSEEPLSQNTQHAESEESVVVTFNGEGRKTFTITATPSDAKWVAVGPQSKTVPYDGAVVELKVKPISWVKVRVVADDVETQPIGFIVHATLPGTGPAREIARASEVHFKGIPDGPVELKSLHHKEVWEFVSIEEE